MLENAIINRPFIVYCLFFVCYLLIYLFFNVISNLLSLVYRAPFKPAYAELGLSV